MALLLISLYYSGAPPPPPSPHLHFSWAGHWQKQRLLKNRHITSPVTFSESVKMYHIDTFVQHILVAVGAPIYCPSAAAHSHPMLTLFRSYPERY